jgi:hypothetical protein
LAYASKVKRDGGRGASYRDVAEVD